MQDKHTQSHTVIPQDYRCAFTCVSTAANIALNSPKKLHQTPFNNPPSQRRWRKTFPYFLTEKKVATASSSDFFKAEPQVQDTREEKEVEAGRNQGLWAGRTEAASNQVMCESLLDLFSPREVKKLVPFRAAGGTGSRGSVYTAGTPNSSVSDPSGTPRCHAAL